MGGESLTASWSGRGERGGGSRDGTKQERKKPDYERKGSSNSKNWILLLHTNEEKFN